MKFTRKGLGALTLGGKLISTHSQETEAIEKALNSPPGKYLFTPAPLEIVVDAVTPAPQPPASPPPPQQPPPAPNPPTPPATQLPNVVVAFGAFTASLVSATYLKTTVSGHKIYRKALNLDLSVWFEQLTAVDWLIWLENGFTMRATPDYTGDMVLTINGQVVATHSNVTLLWKQRAPFWPRNAVTGAEAIVTPREVSYPLVPEVLVTVSQEAIDRMPQVYTPLMQGLFSPGMGTPGYHGSIGFLPEWDITYLASRGAKALRSVLLHGFAGGRFAIHMRDENTQEIASPANLAYAKLSSDNSSVGQRMPASVGSEPPRWAISHHPSIGYLAYMLTGWEYFADEVRFAASWNHFGQADYQRAGHRWGQSPAPTAAEAMLGLLRPEVGTNTTRGAAWALRTLWTASIVDAGQDVYDQLLDNNVAYYHRKYIEQPGNPLGLFSPYSDYTGAGDDKFYTATWMADFEVIVWTHIYKSAPNDAKRLALRDFKAKWIDGRLGAPEDLTRGDYRDVGSYTMPAAPSDAPDWDTGKGPWYKNHGEAYAAMFADATARRATLGTAMRGDSAGAPQATETGYIGSSMAAAYSVLRSGYTAIQPGIDRLRNSSSWPVMVDQFKDMPVWGINGVTNVTTAPPTTTPSPPSQPPVEPPTAPPASVSMDVLTTELPSGKFRRVSVNTMANARPARWIKQPAINIGDPITNWSGGFQTEDGFGTLGSGHITGGTPLWNGVNLFSAETTRAWSMTNAPDQPMLEAAPLNEWRESLAADSLGHTYPQHQYTGLVYQSPAMGGGPKGSLIQCGMAQKCFHKYDLSSPTAPGVRINTNVGTVGPDYPMAALDVKRKGFWYGSYTGQGGLRFFSFVESGDMPMQSWPNVAFNAYGSHNMMLIEVGGQEMLFTIGSDGGGGVETSHYVCPIVNNAPTKWTRVYLPVALPDGRAGGVWVPELGVILSYQGGGSKVVHAITPLTWAVATRTFESFDGAGPSHANGRSNNGTWSRNFWDAKRKVMYHVGGCDEPVTAFKW